MHQNIHVTNKIVHSTYVHTVITRKEDKRKNMKKKKKNWHQSLCKIPFTLIFQVYNAGINYDTCNKNTL